jgi:hypothetical protein
MAPGLGEPPKGQSKKHGYTGQKMQCTVFFSKRRKNSQLCAEHLAVKISVQAKGDYTYTLLAAHFRRPCHENVWSNES